MDGVGGTIKNVIFWKVKSGLFTIHTSFEFDQSFLKYLLAIKSIYLAGNNVLEEPESIDQEAKPIVETHQIHKVERCEVKGVCGMKFFYLAEDEKPFLHNHVQMTKMQLFVGTKIPM